MLQAAFATGHTLLRNSVCFDERCNTLWALDDENAVLTIRLYDQTVTVVATDYEAPITALPMHDGLTAVIVEGNGDVWHVRRDAAARESARLIATTPGGALAAGLHPDSGVVLVLTADALPNGSPGPTLLACEIETGALSAVAGGLAGARIFVVDESSRAAVVGCAGPGGTTVLTTVDLDSGVTTSVETPPLDTFVCFSAGGTVGVLGSSEGSPGQLTYVSNGVAGHSENVGRPIDGIARWGSLLLVASESDVLAVEWDLEAGTMPLTTPLGPLFVNGYARLQADPGAVGLTYADVAFSVREGPDAGMISAGIQKPGADNADSPMLIAGIHPGEYHLDATATADGSVLATRRFRVTRAWPDEKLGPPVAVTGTNQSYALLSWGGQGAAGDNIKPAPRFWRVLVVLVATKDRRWEGFEDGAKSLWKGRVLGERESLKHYYEEVSAWVPGVHGTTIELVGNEVFGPVDLDAGWGDVFKPRKPSDVNAGWTTKSTGYPILCGAISGFLHDAGKGGLLALTDSVVIVTRNGSDSPTPMAAGPIPTRYVWGHARRKDTLFWRKTPGAPSTYTEGEKPVTMMAEKYPEGAPQKNPTHTLCHEIGHNLGLPDLYDAKGDYPAEINARAARWVDLMATSGGIPHFSLANRIGLGWMNRSWLRRFDFSASPAGGAVSLQAVETVGATGPSAGRHAGIEVPIADGWSYMFEYRREQPGHIGDQELESAVPGASRIVVGTDVRYRGGDVARPPILSLPKDVDGDGPLLTNDGENYLDNDTTNPNRMHDFRLTATQIEVPEPNTAQVEVEYVAAHRAQLEVRHAPGGGDFKSPDIAVYGPLGAGAPIVVKDATNVIRVSVRNLGTVAATDVKMRVRWLPFTVAAGDWKPLKDPDPFDVPAGSVTNIVVLWPLPKSVKVNGVEAEHFCFRVDIDAFVNPLDPDQNEVVLWDNWAQSNFDSAPVPEGSPSDRIATVGTATNQLPRRATYLFNVEQSSPWYRFYLGHSWLELDADETAPIELAYESLAGDPVHGQEFERHYERISATDHHVALTSSVIPENTECPTPRDVFGANLRLRAGRRCWIADVRRRGELVEARVWGQHNGETFPVGSGDVFLAAWTEDRPDRHWRHTGTIRPDGTARVVIGGEILEAIERGDRVLTVLARPTDNAFSEAVTEPAPLT